MTFPDCHLPPVKLSWPVQSECVRVTSHETLVVSGTKFLTLLPLYVMFVAEWYTSDPSAQLFLGVPMWTGYEPKGMSAMPVYSSFGAVFRAVVEFRGHLLCRHASRH